MSSFGPYTPLLGAIALGFAKGLTARRDEEPFNLEQNFVGPAKEEFIYRGIPLWLKPNLPFGSTAVIFAADHLRSDYAEAMKHNLPQPTASQVAARFGDVLLGGLTYEAAMRGPFGILGAISAHVLHNAGVHWGSKVRR